MPALFTRRALLGRGLTAYDVIAYDRRKLVNRVLIASWRGTGD